MCIYVYGVFIKQVTRKWIASFWGIFHFTPFRHYFSFRIVMRRVFICCFMVGENNFVQAFCIQPDEDSVQKGINTGRRVLWQFVRKGDTEGTSKVLKRRCRGIQEQDVFIIDTESDVYLSICIYILYGICIRKNCVWTYVCMYLNYQIYKGGIDNSEIIE